MVAITALLLAGLLALIRKPADFGRLLFTDNEPDCGACFYDWQTGKRQPLPDLNYTSDSDRFWNVDQQNIFVESCFVSQLFGCGVLIQRLLPINDLAELKTLKSFWQSSYGQPIWSPDNRLALFDTYELDGDLGKDNYDLRIVNADGTNLHKLLPADVYAFAWLPDSQHVVFVRRTEQDLNVLNLRDGHVQMVANLNERIYDFAPSPDGRQIAFTVDDNISQAYLVDTDGTHLTAISDNGSRNFWLPVWSPDSTQLALSSRDGIFVVSRDGIGLHSIASVDPESDLVWSPDGKQIAFINLQAFLCIIDTDGHGLPACLTDNQALFMTDTPLPVILWLN